MSTTLGTLRDTGSRGVAMTVTRYWGGILSGTCLQLTAEMEEDKTGYIQLSENDVIALCKMLRGADMWPSLLELPH
jgi:putative IMPACT (imprinted ancient) family translation regulator